MYWQTLAADWFLNIENVLGFSIREINDEVLISLSTLSEDDIYDLAFEIVEMKFEEEYLKNRVPEDYISFIERKYRQRYDMVVLAMIGEVKSILSMLIYKKLGLVDIKCNFTLWDFILLRYNNIIYPREDYKKLIVDACKRNDFRAVDNYLDFLEKLDTK